MYICCCLYFYEYSTVFSENIKNECRERVANDMRARTLAEKCMYYANLLINLFYSCSNITAHSDMLFCLFCAFSTHCCRTLQWTGRMDCK